MKSLVFSHTATWPSHHAESIEISLSERELGNEVVFLSCIGSLKTCPAFATPTKKIVKYVVLKLHTQSQKYYLVK